MTVGELANVTRRPLSDMPAARLRRAVLELRRTRREHSLVVRLVGVFGLLVVATVLLVAGTTVLVARAQLTRNLDTQLRGSAESFRLGPAARSAGTVDLATATRRWLAEHPFPLGQMAAVRIGNKDVFASAGNLDMFEVPSPRTLLAARQASWWNLRGSEGPVRGVTAPILTRNGQAGTLVLLAYQRPLDHALQALLAATRRLDLDAPGEIGRLADALDRMLARLEAAFEGERRFLADASHELRTPLTVVRGQLELLADQLDLGRRDMLRKPSRSSIAWPASSKISCCSPASTKACSFEPNPSSSNSSCARRSSAQC